MNRFINLTHEKTVFSPQGKRRTTEENSIRYLFKSKTTAFFLLLKIVFTSVFLRLPCGENCNFSSLKLTAMRLSRGKPVDLQMGLSSFQKLFALALFLFALIQSPLLHSEESPKMSMDSLKYIKSRNIFDPNRVPGVGTTSKKKSKSATVTGQIFLSGTVLLEEKSVAFLTGSTSKKTEIIPLQGTYNGLQVTRIAANEIEVLFEGKTETIPVGAPLLMLAPESAAQTPAIDPTPSPASPPVKVEESGEQSSKKEWYKKRKHGSNNE